MCGIAGILALESSPPNKQQLEKMTRCIVHRGPDEMGHHLDGPIGLGHTRLSIVDLTSGSQPMHDQNSGILVVFGASPTIEKVWKLIRLDIVIPLFESKKDAMARLKESADS